MGAPANGRGPLGLIRSRRIRHRCPINPIRSRTQRLSPFRRCAHSPVRPWLLTPLLYPLYSPNSLFTVLTRRLLAPQSLVCLYRNAKDKGAAIGSTGFKPLDAGAVGKSETIRCRRTTLEKFLGSISGRLGESGSAPVCVSNSKRRSVRWLLSGDQRDDRLDHDQYSSV
jgi:hypothetical protein